MKCPEGKFIETEYSNVNRGGRNRKWRVMTTTYGVSLWEEENVLKLDSEGGCTTL